MLWRCRQRGDQPELFALPEQAKNPLPYIESQNTQLRHDRVGVPRSYGRSKVV